MSLVTNEIRGSMANRYSIPPSEHFKSSQDTVFGVENRAILRFRMPFLNADSTLSLAKMHGLKLIINYLPQSDLASLAKTCRFFHQFLTNQFHLYRMQVRTEDAMNHFFSVLESLNKNDFLPIRVLSLDPSYTVNDQQFLSLIRHLSALEQIALPDIKAVSQRNLHLLAGYQFMRVDFLPPTENTPKEVMTKLDKMSGYFPEKQIEVFVDGKITVNRKFTIHEKLFRISMICTTIICLLSVAVMLGITIGTNNSGSSSGENPLVRPILFSSIAICFLSPCIGIGIPKLIAMCLGNRIHRANYQVIEDV